MATPNIVPRADQEGGLGTAAKSWGKLFIENAAAGGTAAATISNLDANQIALDINAENTNGDIIDVTCATLTSGSLLKYVGTSTPADTANPKIIDLDIDFDGVGSSDFKCIYMNIDKDGITASGKTANVYGMHMDLDSTVVNVGAVNMYGIAINNNFSNDGGVVGAYGLLASVSGADTNYGLDITVENGAGYDAMFRSSAVSGDYFTIVTGAAGATALTTVDSGGLNGTLTLTADGTLDLNAGAHFDLDADISMTLTAAYDSSVKVIGSGQDLDISVEGGGTQELRLASAGTGASALHLNASAGSVDIDSADNITIDAADDITVVADSIKLTGDIHVEDLTPTMSVITNTDFTAVDKYEYVIKDANGGDVVLPAAAAGSRINFIWGVTQTGSVTITAATGDILEGHAIITSMVSDSSNSAVYFAPAGGDDLIITLNGGTTGGFIGDTIELVGISAEEWRVRAKLSSTTAAGSLVTPFS